MWAARRADGRATPRGQAWPWRRPTPAGAVTTLRAYVTCSGATSPALAALARRPARWTLPRTAGSDHNAADPSALGDSEFAGFDPSRSWSSLTPSSRRDLTPHPAPGLGDGRAHELDRRGSAPRRPPASARRAEGPEGA